MRESKFRVRWIHPESDCEGFDYFEVLEGFRMCDPCQDIIDVQQYIGLSDSTGKDIYEGDILKHTSVPLILWVVCFEHGSFGVKNVGNDKFFRIDSSLYFIDRKIIGNIHETPHLMKVA